MVRIQRREWGTTVVQPTVERSTSVRQPWHHLVFGRDTNVQAARVLVVGIRRQTFAARAESIRGINRLVGQVAMAGARSRLPDAPVAALAYEVDRRRYGAEIAAAIACWRRERNIDPEVEHYMAADPFPLLYTVADALEAAGIEYVVTGSLASGVYGPPRSTNGVDLVARLTPPAIDLFLHALPPELYADREMTADAVRRRSSFNIIDAISGAKVAVYVSDERPFTREQLSRARTLALGPAGRPLPFASPEGVILAKLRWYRDGGETSEQQWRDVAGILTIMAPELDRVWLEQWAVRLGVHDLLDRMHSGLAGQD
jgi:hypothetical protein